MNVVSELASHPSAVNRESLQVLAQWLKNNGATRVRQTDPRRAIIERYPAGLINDAELEALLGIWHG
ncbi:hypothetical protein [Pseudomonas akapageensis]|uniref:hypothetical protein n=1 Tax=Pseudomonas akapageensis TaxID=2609961 RepID=UPI00140AADE6|nr:hypothetical protein [Pseudomonas akapageensis]